MEKTRKLGARIKELREGLGLTQAELAEMVNRNPHTIKDYESGRAAPSVRALELLAGALGVPERELLDDSVATVTKITPLSPSKALRMYLNIPDEIIKLAQKIGRDDKIWEFIKGALESAGEKKEKEEKKTNHN
jgi:transcriptional regulator with XRE-family HTH domain